MVRFLQNPEIDPVKWDKCVAGSQQGMIYAMSWYLDLVSPGWCGLAKDDYSIVMPLPVKKKYGINYLVQPLYAQQLGLFSPDLTTFSIIKEFINEIPVKYRYIALNLNYENTGLPDSWSLKMNNNFVLDLNPGYQSIAEAYSENTKRNLLKAKSLDICFEGSLDELIRLKAENTGSHRRHISTKLISSFVSAVMEKGAGFIASAAYDRETCASVFFLRDNKRIYYLIPVSNPIGKEKKAMFAIIDAVIKKFAGSTLILDFEGSNLPGPARFFNGFTTVNQPYPSITINRLPFPLNKIRKS